MRLSNEDVLLHWPLAQHIITAGWLYNDGSLHRALDFRAAVGTPCTPQRVARLQSHTAGTASAPREIPTVTAT